MTFWLSLPVHSGSLKRIDYPKRICLANAINFLNVFTALKGTHLYILFGPVPNVNFTCDMYTNDTEFVSRQCYDVITHNRKIKITSIHRNKMLMKRLHAFLLFSAMKFYYF